MPVPLRRLARFTPAKRARLGGAALLAELAAVPAFRAAVVAWWDEQPPRRAGADRDRRGRRPAAGAAAAVLAGDPAAAEAVAAAARRGEAGELRAERDAALSRVDKLTVELERLRGELTEARAQARQAGRAAGRRVPAAAPPGVASRARSCAPRWTPGPPPSAAAGGAAPARRTPSWPRPRAERDRERARAEAERRRADRAAAEVAAARQAAREARQADEVRLALLLDTLGGAVERAAPGAGPRAAAGRARPTWSPARRPRAAGSVADGRAALDALLAVPSVHLIVDGYNVSKTGYPELPLADQRTRLVGQLAALAARTGVEITVVFDGAGVVTAPTRGRAGCGCCSATPGVLADDVIRDLVAAEPQGRPVVVATSDRAVVDSVRRRGAHTVPSAVLLGRLVRAADRCGPSRKTVGGSLLPSVGHRHRPSAREQR